jgi:hypothetical protein
VWGLAGAGVNDNAAICDMIAVWFCDSCLKAAAISEVMEAGIDGWAMPDVPVVAFAAAAMGVIVVNVSSSVSSSTPSKTLHMV